MRNTTHKQINIDPEMVKLYSEIPKRTNPSKTARQNVSYESNVFLVMNTDENKNIFSWMKVTVGVLLV